MGAPIRITYLRQSGFAVQVRDTLLVFDDAQGVNPQLSSLKEGYVTSELVESVQRTLFFVSHSHEDHFNSDIYRFKDLGVVHYVLGDDLPLRYAGHRMSAGDTLSLGGAEIKAYDSTDAGVSFLVKIDGWTLFHAGDLNLWHWREQSTLKEIEQAERDYEAAVAPLYDQEMDFAFFPLDPRMGEMYDAGALHFTMHVKPRVMIPMHWGQREDAALDFARRNRSRHVEIVPLIKPGQTICAVKDEDGNIRLAEEGWQAEEEKEKPAVR